MKNSMIQSRGFIRRRDFIKSCAAASAVFSAPNILRGAGVKEPLIWANLLQLGCNMWNDHDADKFKEFASNGTADYLRFDENVWRNLTERMHDIGMNMIIIDLAEGLVYPSHPELAVKGSWTPEKLRTELARLRRMGLEPIPKLNFSATHDVWLKDYARMVSTEIYHKVVADLVKDVCEIFDRPRFVHIGMDEEGELLQTKFRYALTRREDVWFDDLKRITAAIERCGARAWMWSDLGWNYPDYYNNVPKSVMQSNWYYWKDVKEIEAKLDDPKFSTGTKRPDWAGQNHAAELKGFYDLEKAGYDQMPCATTWNSNENMEQVIDFCLRRLDRKRLKGFLLTPWEFTLDKEKTLRKHDNFLSLTEGLIKKYGDA